MKMLIITSGTVIVLVIISHVIHHASTDTRHNTTVLSDASMASARSHEFKTVYHPRSGRETVYQTFDEFGVTPKTDASVPIDAEPWRPFRSRGDFEFSEIALDAALNKAQIDSLLNLISRISEGKTNVTLKNEADLRRAWDNAAEELTPASLGVAVVYNVYR